MTYSPIIKQGVEWGGEAAPLYPVPRSNQVISIPKVPKACLAADRRSDSGRFGREIPSSSALKQ